MKNKMLLLFGLLLAGCVPCWNPLYTENDLVFDPMLVGMWSPIQAQEGSQEAWAFTRSSGKLYKLQQTDEEGDKASFAIGLVQLGEHRFMDLVLTEVEGDVKLNAWAGFSLVPAHLILKVEQIEPTLKIAAMNPDWMEKFVKHHPDAIAHRIAFDNRVVLTASTSELQKFILEHVNEEEFFGGAMELKRKAGAGEKDRSVKHSLSQTN